MAKNGDTPTPIELDVLILHGRDPYLVEYLSKLFTSVGLRSSTAEALPSHQRHQEAKVDLYIQQCRIPVVLVTFDESNRARPNVYDELARCRTLRPDDMIVLREERGGARVDVGSNTEGKFVEINFDTGQLHAMIPPLLVELKSRGLVSGSAESGPRDLGNFLNAFLDKMDAIWEQIDGAWNNVHRQDYEAENELTVRLDQFFQQYHHVFHALVRDGRRGDTLRAVCETSLSEAAKLAVAAWEAAAQGKMKHADALTNDPRLKPTARRHHKLYDRAGSELKKARKSTRTSDERIAGFRTAIDLAQEYIDEVSRHGSTGRAV